MRASWPVSAATGGDQLGEAPNSRLRGGPNGSGTFGAVVGTTTGAADQSPVIGLPTDPNVVVVVGSGEAGRSWITGAHTNRSVGRPCEPKS